MTLTDLAKTLMELYQMDGSHLYRVLFLPKGGRTRNMLHFEPPESSRDSFFFSPPPPKAARDLEGDDDDIESGTREPSFEVNDPGDSDNFRLCDISTQKGAKFFLHYDFGDDWLVSSRIKKVFVDDKLDDVRFPRVLKGEGYGIVEDAGGPWGLKELFAVSENGEHSERYNDWFDGEVIDLAEFDIDEMNFKIR
jgi:hypothetical protein